MVPNSKSLKYDPLCQAAFHHQLQIPRIDLGADHHQHRARRGRYAVLFELKV